MTDKERPYSHHAQFHGWQVEARLSTDRPANLGEDIFDSQWRTVNFAKVRPPFGVPNSGLHGNILDDCGLYGYETAQALRWWFHANVPFLSGLETRLVSFKVKSDVEWFRDGEQDLVEDRMGLKMPTKQE